MVNRAGLVELYHYNDYANQLVLDITSQLTEDELYRKISPGQNTVHQLIYHMLGVETFFFKRCREQSYEPRPTDLPALADIRSYWQGIALERQEYLTALEEKELTYKIEIVFNNQQLYYPRWQLLLQALIHSIHHRGELAIILSEFDHPLPTLDIIIHFTQQSGQQWPF